MSELCQVRFRFFLGWYFAQVLPDLHHGQRVWGAAPLRLSWDVGSDPCCTARAEQKMPVAADAAGDGTVGS